MISHSFFILYYTGRIVVIEEDSVRFAHSGPSHCHLRHRYAITWVMVQKTVGKLA